MEVAPETLRRWRDTIEQAMGCLKGETPEDVSFGEAEDDTFSKLNEAMGEISTTLLSIK